MFEYARLNFRATSLTTAPPLHHRRDVVRTDVVFILLSIRMAREDSGTTGAVTIDDSGQLRVAQLRVGAEPSTRALVVMCTAASCYPRVLLQCHVLHEALKVDGHEFPAPRCQPTRCKRFK